MRLRFNDLWKIEGLFACDSFEIEIGVCRKSYREHRRVEDLRLSHYRVEH